MAVRVGETIIARTALERQTPSGAAVTTVAELAHRSLQSTPPLPPYGQGEEGAGVGGGLSRIASRDHTRLIAPEPVNTEELFEAVRTGTIEAVTAMLETTDIDVGAEHGKSLLHVAVAAGRIEMVRCILKKKPNLTSKYQSAKSPYRLTPLGLAVYLKQIPCLEVLLASNPDLLVHGFEDGNLVHLAIEVRSLAALALFKTHQQWADLLGETNSLNMTPAELASHHQDFDALTYITGINLSLEEALPHVYPTTWIFDQIGAETLGLLYHLPSEAYANVTHFVGSGSGALVGLLLALGASPLEIVARLKTWGDSTQEEILRSEVKRALAELSGERAPKLLTLFSSAGAVHLFAGTDLDIVDCVVNSVLHPASCGNANRKALYFQHPDDTPPQFGLRLVAQPEHTLEELLKTKGTSFTVSVERTKQAVSTFHRQIMLAADPLLRKMCEVGIDPSFLPPQPFQRVKLLRQLRVALLEQETEQNVVLMRESVSGHKILHGPPGVGKSVVAAHFIRECCTGHYLYVVNGATAETIRNSYLQIALAMGFHIGKYETLPALQEMVHHRLELLEEPWVLYIHKATEELPLPETTPHGICLVTSRTTRGWGASDLFEVPNLTRWEAIQFMVAELRGSEAYEAIVYFINHTDYSLHLLEECMMCCRLSEMSFSDFVSKVFATEGETVEARMWRIVLQKIENEDAQAYQLLQALACLGEKAIPFHWIETYVTGNLSSDGCVQLMQVLSAYPFCQYDEERKLFFIKSAIKPHISEISDETRSSVVDFLISQSVFDENQQSTWAEGLYWASHLAHITSNLRPAELRKKNLTTPFTLVADCFSVHGHLYSAANAYERALHTLPVDTISVTQSDLWWKFGKISHLIENHLVAENAYNTALTTLDHLKRAREDLEKELAELRQNQANPQGSRQQEILAQTQGISEQNLNMKRAAIWHARGNFYKATGRHQSAREAYCMSITLRATLHSRHFDCLTAHSQMEWAESHYGKREYGMGLEIVDLASGILSRKFGQQSHPDMARIYRLLAIGFLHTDQLEKAVQASMNAHAILTTLYPKLDHPHLAEICQLASVIYFRRQQYEEALRFSEQSAAIAERCYPVLPRLVKAKAMQVRAEVYAKQKKIAESAACFQESLSIFQILIPNAWEHTRSLENQANNFVQMGNPKKAIPYFLEACEIYQIWDHDNPSEALAKLAEQYATNNPEIALRRRLAAIKEVKEKEDWQTNPKLLKERAELYVGVAIAQEALGNEFDACASLESAAKILGTPGICEYALPIANCALSIAIQLREEGFHTRALQFYKDGIELFRRVEQSNPARLFPLTGILIPRKREVGDTKSAIELYGKLIGVVESSLAAGTGDYSTNQLIDLYIDRYELYESVGEFTSARGTIKSAIGKWDELCPHAGEIVAPCTVFAEEAESPADLQYLYDAHLIYVAVNREDQSATHPLESFITTLDEAGRSHDKAAYQRELVNIFHRRLVEDQPTPAYANALRQLFDTIHPQSREEADRIFTLAYDACRTLYPAYVPLAEIPYRQGNVDYAGNKFKCYSDALSVYPESPNANNEGEPVDRLLEVTNERRRKGDPRIARDYMRRLLEEQERRLLITRQQNPQAAESLSHGRTLLLLAAVEEDLSARPYVFGQYRASNEHMSRAIEILGRHQQNTAPMQERIDRYENSWTALRIKATSYVLSWIPSVGRAAVAADESSEGGE